MMLAGRIKNAWSVLHRGCKPRRAEVHEVIKDIFYILVQIKIVFSPSEVAINQK